MSAPRQMTAHTLETPKGWPSPTAVDFVAKISANVTLDPVYAGRCVHLNNSGEFELGMPDVSRACHMPMFLFQNSDDPDVSNPGGNPATDAGAWVAVQPTGRIMALPAKGAYEMETTEFRPAASDGTYYPGDGLTALTEADALSQLSDKTKAGMLLHGVAYDVPLVGVVSRGVYTNSHKKTALCFWPQWLPRYKA